jgi:hypothetical protein
VALINHDEVEKVGREFTEKFLSVLGTGNGLIEGEVNFIGCIDTPVVTRLLAASILEVVLEDNVIC